MSFAQRCIALRSDHESKVLGLYAQVNRGSEPAFLEKNGSPGAQDGALREALRSRSEEAALLRSVNADLTAKASPKP